MATRNRKSGNGNKPHGHFCKVCGEHKANEKFSGKGHAAHICKACAGLPAAERTEMMTIRKIEGMAFRYLSESEIKWLRNHMKDSHPNVRTAAIEAHQIKFPRYERSMAKKGMTAFSLELYVHDEVYSDWCDTVDVNVRVFAEHGGLFRYIDYDAPEGEHQIQIEPKETRRFLKAVVHELNAPFWDKDYSDGEYKYDPYLDILSEYRPEFDDEDEEPEPEPPLSEDRKPLWSLHMELNTGEDKAIAFYNNTPDAVTELFWLIMEYFKPDESNDGDE